MSKVYISNVTNQLSKRNLLNGLFLRGKYLSCNLIVKHISPQTLCNEHCCQATVTRVNVTLRKTLPVNVR